MSRIGRRIIQKVMIHKGYDIIEYPLYDTYYIKSEPIYTIGTYFMLTEETDRLVLYSGFFSLMNHILRNIDNV